MEMSPGPREAPAHMAEPVQPAVAGFGDATPMLGGVTPALPGVRVVPGLGDATPMLAHHGSSGDITPAPAPTLFVPRTPGPAPRVAPSSGWRRMESRSQPGHFYYWNDITQ